MNPKDYKMTAKTLPETTSDLLQRMLSVEGSSTILIQTNSNTFVHLFFFYSLTVYFEKKGNFFLYYYGCTF